MHVGVARGWPLHLHPSLLFNPVPKFREPCVHAGLVPLSAAITPAHHTSLENPPVGFHAGQGAPGVALRGDQRLSVSASPACALARQMAPGLGPRPLPEPRPPSRAPLRPAHYPFPPPPPRAHLAGVHATAEVAHAHHAGGDLLREQVLTGRLVDDADLALLQDQRACAWVEGEK